jgi:hypothetical protein
VGFVGVPPCCAGLRSHQTRRFSIKCAGVLKWVFENIQKRSKTFKNIQKLGKNIQKLTRNIRKYSNFL